MAKHQYHEASSPTSKGKRIHHLEVQEGEDGGHIVRHFYHDDGMTFHRPVEHVFGADEGDLALAHIAKHAKINESGRGERSRDDAEEEGE